MNITIVKTTCKNKKEAKKISRLCDEAIFLFKIKMIVELK